MEANNGIARPYGQHVASVQQHWETALAAEGYDAALIHAGSKLASFLDDYEYAFRSNPHFLSWLPLCHHHDSVVLIRPGVSSRKLWSISSIFLVQLLTRPEGVTLSQPKRRW